MTNLSKIDDRCKFDAKSDYSKDGKKAQQIYSALFSWKINANNPMKYGLAKAGMKKESTAALDKLNVAGHGR